MSTASRDDSQACQRCHQPLVLDPSISNLTAKQHSLLTTALPDPGGTSTLSPASKLASLPPSSRQGAAAWGAAHNVRPRPVAESFILLGESVANVSVGAGAAAGSSRHPHSSPDLAANLHSILSSRTPISHPLCVDCTGMLQVELQKELEELSRERDAYINFERGILRNREEIKSGSKAKRRKSVENDEAGMGLGEYDLEGDEDEWRDLSAERDKLEAEEARLMRILEEKERQLDAVREEEQHVKEEEKEVERQETEYLLAHAELSTELDRQEKALSTARTKLLLSTSMLRHLESTNVYNDAFQIGHVPLQPDSRSSSITVGTINGLRLGGRPVVEWDEINAAWGLVALCIDRIAAKVGCVFDHYKILPLGSFSRIEDLPPGKNSYDLYYSTEFTQVLQTRKFNHGLVALLDCLRQLVDFGRKNGRDWGKGNIEIRKDRISSYSIRLPGFATPQSFLPGAMSLMGLGGSSSGSSGHAAGGNNNNSGNSGSGDSTGEEGWTRACRAVLQVLKRILVVESGEGERTIQPGPFAIGPGGRR